MKEIIEPVSFNTMLEWLGEQTQFPKPLVIKPIKAELEVWTFGNCILVRNSKGQEKVIDKKFWEEVMEHMKTLDGEKRVQTSSYTYPNYNMPDNHFRPVPMGLCMVYLESKK